MYAVFNYHTPVSNTDDKLKPEPSISLLRSNLSSENVGVLQSYVAKRSIAGKWNGFDHLKLIKDESEEVEWTVYYMDIDSPSDNNQRRLACLCDEDMRNIDLFREELSNYIGQKIASAGDEEIASEHFTLNWKTECLEYLQRSIEFLGSYLEKFIASVCVGYHVEFCGISPRGERDLKMFVESLTLLESPSLGKENTVTLKFENGELSMPLDVSIPACRLFAKRLKESYNLQAHEIKTIIMDFKLNVNQCLNQTRILLSQSEHDFYRLYQFFCFLQRCDYLLILMQHSAFITSLTPEQQKLLQFVEGIRSELATDI